MALNQCNIIIIISQFYIQIICPMLRYSNETDKYNFLIQRSQILISLYSEYYN